MSETLIASILSGAAGAIVGAVAAILGPLMLHRRQERITERKQSETDASQRREAAVQKVLADYLDCRTWTRQLLDVLRLARVDILTGNQINLEAVQIYGARLGSFFYYYYPEMLEYSDLDPYRDFNDAAEDVLHEVHRAAGRDAPFGAEKLSREEWVAGTLDPALERLETARGSLMERVKLSVVEVLDRNSDELILESRPSSTKDDPGK